MPICMLLNVLKYSIFFVCEPLGLSLYITSFHLVGVIYIKYVMSLSQLENCNAFSRLIILDYYELDTDQI